MVKATWHGAVLAESDETIVIEGNHYFPPDSVNMEYFRASDRHTSCSWKGIASYYDLSVDGDTNSAAAWYYPEPKKSSFEIVGEDYSNYIAFWKGVSVED